MLVMDRTGSMNDLGNPAEKRLYLQKALNSFISKQRQILYSGSSKPRAPQAQKFSKWSYGLCWFGFLRLHRSYLFPNSNLRNFGIRFKEHDGNKAAMY